MSITTIVCPFDSEYRVELDPSQVFPDDPGNGTPEMVYGPNDTSGTFFCTIDTGELDGIRLPFAVLAWLGSDHVVNAIDAFWEEVS